MKSPTANVLSRLVWLGDGGNTAQGSGTLVSYDGVEYLVTAHHVYVDCGGNPSVRFRARWNRLQWEVVAKDESLDVIVLKFWGDSSRYSTASRKALYTVRLAIRWVFREYTSRTINSKLITYWKSAVDLFQ